MKRIVFIILIVIFLFCFSKSKFSIIEDMESIKSILDQNGQFIIFFHAGWSNDSNKVKKLVLSLENDKIMDDKNKNDHFLNIIIINHSNKELISKFKPTIFPSLAIVKENQIHFFKNGLIDNKSEILKWIEEKFKKYNLITLDTLAEIDQKLNDNKVIVLFLHKSNNETNINDNNQHKFLELGEAINKSLEINCFLYLNRLDIFSLYSKIAENHKYFNYNEVEINQFKENNNDLLVIFKKYDEIINLIELKENPMDKNVKKLIKNVRYLIHNKINILSQTNYYYLSHNRLNYITLIFDSNKRFKCDKYNDYDDYDNKNINKDEDSFNSEIKSFYHRINKYFFMKSDYEEVSRTPILHEFNISQNILPCVVLYEIDDEKNENIKIVIKRRYCGNNLNVKENCFISNALENVLNDKSPVYLKSEDNNNSENLSEKREEFLRKNVIYLTINDLIEKISFSSNYFLLLLSKRSNSYSKHVEDIFFKVSTKEKIDKIGKLSKLTFGYINTNLNEPPSFLNFNSSNLILMKNNNKCEQISVNNFHLCVITIIYENPEISVENILEFLNLNIKIDFENEKNLEIKDNRKIDL